jgi:hypothetical protein
MAADEPQMGLLQVLQVLGRQLQRARLQASKQA